MNYSSGIAPAEWIGPFRIGDYLSRVAQEKRSRPPGTRGLYVVSERSWAEQPSGEAGILYAGQAHYLRYRIGQLLLDLLGFTSDDCAEGEAYAHRAGHFLWHQHCLKRGIEPLDLYVAWYPRCQCLDCGEAKLLDLSSFEWKPSPRQCSQHSPMLELSDNCAVHATVYAKLVRLRSMSRN